MTVFQFEPFVWVLQTLAAAFQIIHFTVTWVIWCEVKMTKLHTENVLQSVQKLDSSISDSSR